MKKRKIIPILICVMLAYVLVGMMLPFLKLKKVDSAELAGASAARFYGDSVSVDRAAIVETGVQALDARIAMAAGAKERIILSTFDMREGESVRDLLAVLLDAADRGVQVQILVDGLSGRLRMEGRDLFYAMSSHPNVEIRTYNPPELLKPWTLHGRMHDKYFVVDDKAYLLGGRNTFDYFLGDYIEEGKSLDREVFVYNTETGSLESSLYQVLDYFEKVWDGGDCYVFHDEEALSRRRAVQKEREKLGQRLEKLQTERPELFDAQIDYTAYTVPTEKITLISNPTHIYGKEPVVLSELQQLMEHAQERVYLHTPYAVLSEDMYENLERVAEKDIEFEVLINSVANGDNLVASSDYCKNKERILETGADLYEYEGGISTHSKSLLIDDDISVVGSFNYDMRSAYVDTELMLVIDSQELNQELEDCMEELRIDSRKVLPGDRYETPEHLQVQQAPLWKQVVFTVLGILLIPFRVLV